MHSLAPPHKSLSEEPFSDNRRIFELEEILEVIGHPHHFMNEDILGPKRESNFSEVTQLIKTKIQQKPWASQLTM